MIDRKAAELIYRTARARLPELDQAAEKALGRRPAIEEFEEYYSNLVALIQAAVLATLHGMGQPLERMEAWLAKASVFTQFFLRQEHGSPLGLKVQSQLMDAGPAAPADEKPPAAEESCACAKPDGRCVSCQAALRQKVEGFAEVLHKLAAMKDQSPGCKPCNRELADGVIAEGIRKHFPAFDPQMREMIIAIAVPSVAQATKVIEWPEVEKAIQEVQAPGQG